MELKTISKHLKQKALREKGVWNMLKDKRGMGIADLYPVMLTICLVAILIAIVLFILDEFGQQVAVDTHAVTNESDGFINTTGYVLDEVDECNFNTPIITAVWNKTTNDLMPSGNYTVNSAGIVTNVTASETSTYGYFVNISYTYKSGGTACEVTEDISEDIADFVPWIGIILLVVAAAIVLGILIRNLAGGSSRV